MDPESADTHRQSPESHDKLGVMAWLKKAAKQLKRSVLALHYATQDPDVGWAPCLIAAFVLAYALSPMDLIPDFIPVLGILDDLLLLPGMIWLAIELIPDDVWQRAQQRADEEPLRLSKCWPAACCIFLLWNASAVGLTYLLCKKFRSSWWSRHWWIPAAVVAGLLSCAEAAWTVVSLRSEKVKAQSAKVLPDDAGLNAPLVSDESRAPS